MYAFRVRRFWGIKAVAYTLVQGKWLLVKQMQLTFKNLLDFGLGTKLFTKSQQNLPK
eukprot:c6620_g2_i1 orf=79-249(+)